MRFTEEEKLTLVEHYKSGATASSICAEAGIARSTFYSWVKPYGTVLTKGNELITLRELDKLRKHTEKLEKGVYVFLLKQYTYPQFLEHTHISQAVQRVAGKT